MYQSTKKQCHQITFFDFNQSCGMQLDRNNEWVLLGDRITWRITWGKAILFLHVICNYLTILELYRQQKYMFDNKVHRVKNRIVSISQPYLRPIVRGKAKTTVEFGAKYDVSIDEAGHARLEKNIL